MNVRRPAAPDSGGADSLADKAFETLRAEGAVLSRAMVYRTDSRDGHVIFVSVAHGHVRLHPDLRSLRARLDELAERRLG